MGEATTAIQVLTGREVPLGGVRAITVRRTLPHRDRAFIGAWCFVDHYGPHDVSADGRGGMDLPPHPHTGLQTVSWLFSGAIEHRDSGGVVAAVTPGEVNLMTAGHGICHSEVTTAETRTLHGVQLWVVLPQDAHDTERGFDHHVTTPVPLPDGAGTVRVFVGSLPGLGSSPITLHSRLVGAQLDLGPDARLRLPIERDFEHAVLLDSGAVTVSDTEIHPGDLACLDPGPGHLDLTAGPDGARILLLGGEPFDEEVVMWWNFIGRSHDEVVAFREAWQREDAQFGRVEGYVGEVARLPAPPIPPVRLRPRSRHGKR